MKRAILYILTLLFSVNTLFAQSAEQAESYYQNGDYAKAIEEYNAILNQGESSAELYFNLGNCYYIGGILC